MADPVVLFDTNTLPRPTTVDGPFWQAIFRLCKIAGVTPSIPEVVLHESVNLLKENVTEASEKLVSAYKILSKQIDAPPIYIPSPESVASDWEDQLRQSFDVVSVHGDDAIEALTREALRRRPARNGRGARDSAIWLTAVRISAIGTIVHLVSKNTSDFGGQKTDLHEDLLAEVHERGITLSYWSSIDEFIATIATSDVNGAAGLEMASELVLEALLGVLSDVSLEIDELGDVHSTFTDIAVKRAYTADTTSLALIHGRVAIAGASDNELIGGQGQAWVTFDPSTKVLQSVDFVSFDADGDGENDLDALTL
jgi:hypothetical protein